MKAWKTIAVIALAFTAIALITTTALAYHSDGQGPNGPSDSYGTVPSQGTRGDMMHGPMRGPMGHGCSQYSNYTSPND